MGSQISFPISEKKRKKKREKLEKLDFH